MVWHIDMSLDVACYIAISAYHFVIKAAGFAACRELQDLVLLIEAATVVIAAGVRLLDIAFAGAVDGVIVAQVLGMTTHATVCLCLSGIYSSRPIHTRLVTLSMHAVPMCIFLVFGLAGGVRWGILHGALAGIACACGLLVGCLSVVATAHGFCP